MPSKKKGDFRERLAIWMIGRNGVDDLARASLGFGIIVLILEFIVNIWSKTAASLLSWVFLASIIYYWFRVISRNVEKRQKENRAWVKRFSRVAIPCRRKYSQMKDWKKYHKDYKLYTCKKCKQSLKVPKGKGTIRVTCPKCGNKFETKS